VKRAFSALTLAVVPYAAGIVAYVGNWEFPETYTIGLRMAGQFLMTHGFWPCIFTFAIISYLLHKLERSGEARIDVVQDSTTSHM
jgi:hypothetical protein